MNPVRQTFHDAFEALNSKKAGKLAGYQVRPLSMWHIAMLHRLDGELEQSDRVSGNWLIIQVLRWPPLCKDWRLRLAMAEPGWFNLRAWLSVRQIMRDLDGFEAKLKQYWELWFAKPPTKGETKEVDESGQQKKSPKKGVTSPWFMLVICELLDLGFSHDEAWKMNPGYALHLLWANRERGGAETPLIDEDTAQILQEMGAW